MVQILSSELALRLLIALWPDRALPLTRLAEAVEAPLSSTQSALHILVSDGLVIDSARGKGRRYRLADTNAVRHLIGLARSTIPVRELLSIFARADPAIEFMALQGDELVVVFSATAGALDEAATATALRELCPRSAFHLHYEYHDDVRRELLADPRRRSRMASAEILYGDLDRTFPDRRSHGMTEGRALGTVHASIRLPSRRRLQRLAREHKLASLRLFGSATRSDFRPDSDLDIAVRYQPGIEPSLRSLREVEDELERATGRDVELLDEDSLDPEIREAVEREAVSLL
jgi:predicted nucleotidyltransferase